MTDWNLKNILFSMITFDIVFTFLMSSLGVSYISIPTIAFPSSSSITYIANGILASWGTWTWDILGYIISWYPLELLLANGWAVIVFIGNSFITIFDFFTFLYSIMTIPYLIMPYPLNFLVESVFAITIIISVITGFEIFSTRLHGD